MFDKVGRNLAGSGKNWWSGQKLYLSLPFGGSESTMVVGILAFRGSELGILIFGSSELGILSFRDSEFGIFGFGRFRIQVFSF